MDIVPAAAIYIGLVRAAAAGWSATEVALLAAVFALAYSLASVAVGRVLTEANAGRLVAVSGLWTAAVTLAMIAWPDLRALWGLLPLLAAGVALFFVPFQVFMKTVDREQARPLRHSTALYTFSWSAGYAIGPFVAGALWSRFDWRHGLAFAAAASLFTFFGVRRLRAADGPPAPAMAMAEESNPPDLAWMAWLCGGLGCLSIAVIRGVFPSTGEHCRLEKIEIGNAFALLSGVQALVGLLLGAGRTWMYRPGPLLGFALCGAAGLGLFAFASTAPGFYAAAILYGVYSGSFFFYFVWHSLVHPEKSSRYIAVNEAVVGLTGVFGPPVGGWIADRWGMPAPYAAAAGLVLLAAAIMVKVHGGRGAARPSAG